MKVEFESVLFGLAFLALALISLPGNRETPPEEAASQPSADLAANQTAPASGR